MNQEWPLVDIHKGPLHLVVGSNGIFRQTNLLTKDC